MKTRFWNPSWLIALLMAAATAGSHAQVTATGSKYLLRYSFRPGTTMSFTMETAMGIPGNAGGKPIPLSMPFTIKVKSVSKGIASVEYTLTLPNMGQAGGGTQTQTIKQDATGKPVGGGVTPSGVSFGLPSKAVKVGDTWQSSVPGGMGGLAGVTVTTKYKFLGLQTVAGKRVAAVGITSSANRKVSAKSSISVKGTGTIYLLVQDGWLHAADLTQHIVLILDGGKPTTSTATTKVARTY